MSLERTPGVSYPLTERQRLEIRRAEREAEAEEQKRKAAEMQPILSAQAELNKTAVSLRELEREAVVSGKPDPGFILPESVAGKRMNLAVAEQFNRQEARKFVANTREYYPCKKNLETMVDYLLKQGVQIADEQTYRVAFERLRYLGLLEERPEPEPIFAEVKADPKPPDPDEAKRLAWEKFTTETVAVDPRDGRTWTGWQLEHEATAEEFRFLLNIPRVPRAVPVKENN